MGRGAWWSSGAPYLPPELPPYQAGSHRHGIQRRHDGNVDLGDAGSRADVVVRLRHAAGGVEELDGQA